MKKSTQSSDIRGGIALAITFFIVSVFLYFQPQYFGPLTKLVAIILIVVGFVGLGFELERLTSRKRGSVVHRGTEAGVFDNLGIGLAALVIWIALYYYFPVIWINVLTSVFLLFSVYAITLGLINLLFRVVPQSSRDNNLPGVDPKSKIIPLSVKIIVVISGIIGFIASVIQILEFLKIVPS